MWSRQRGIGLLELMLSMTILAIITIMSVSYYQSASRSQRLAQATAMISDIYAASKDYVKFSPNDLSIDNMVTAGLLTTYYKSNPWKAADTDNATHASLKDSTLTIELDGVNLNACRLLMTRIKQTLTNSGKTGSEHAYCSGGGKSRVQTFSVQYDLY